MKWLRKLFVRLPWVQDERQDAHQTGWHSGRSAILGQTGWTRWTNEEPSSRLTIDLMHSDWHEPDRITPSQHNYVGRKGMYWKEVA